MKHNHPITYLFVTKNNAILGRNDSLTYTNESDGKIIALPLYDLAQAISIAKKHAMDLNLKIEEDIVVSLNHPKIKEITNA